MTEQLQTWYESLGGIDCETCGFSFDEVEITRISGQELFDARCRLGCYGGAAAENLTLDEVKAWLDTELGDLPEYRQVRKRLRRALNQNTPDYTEDVWEPEVEEPLTPQEEAELQASSSANQ